jgi:two-component system LytT family response regulator
MIKLNTLIVDDEEFARSSLYFLLQNNCPQIHICGIAKSVAEAKTILKEKQIELIFLDIAMPVENGFSLIPFINSAQTAVIFTTAYNQYAIKAIKANALDYLLKPIDIEELKLAVLRAEEYHLSKNKNAKVDPLKELAQSLQNNPDNPNKLIVPGNLGYRLLNFEDILHIEADSNYSIINLSNGERITSAKTLKEYEEILPESSFFRVHKSNLVNLNYITECHNKNGLSVLMKNGDTIAVSRRRASELMDKIRR